MKRQKIQASELWRRYSEGEREFINFEVIGEEMSRRAFQNTNFTGCRFRRGSLFATSFSDCCLDNTEFDGINMAAVGFTECSAKNAFFVECAMRGAFIGGKSSFQGATFQNCQVSGINGGSPHLVGAKFINCSLNGGWNYDGLFESLEFIDCDLRGYSISTCTFTRVRMENCDLRGCNFFEISFVDVLMSNCDLRASDFELSKSREWIGNETTMPDGSIKSGSLI